MKKLYIIIPAVLLALLIGLTSITVNADFAAYADMKYHYTDEAIDVTITDREDIQKLKSILNGKIAKDSPACGFTDDVSVTLTDFEKSVTFCPACDGCPLFRIGETDYYLAVSDETRALFDEIVKKYGMKFPCV